MASPPSDPNDPWSGVDAIAARDSGISDETVATASRLVDLFPVSDDVKRAAVAQARLLSFPVGADRYPARVRLMGSIMAVLDRLAPGVLSDPARHDEIATALRLGLGAGSAELDLIWPSLAQPYIPGSQRTFPAAVNGSSLKITRLVRCGFHLGEIYVPAWVETARA